MALYLKLFHGRKTPTEQLDDWGSDGPVFGPLSYVHTTYGEHVKLGAPDGDNLGDLFVSEDLLYYDKVYYGDWSAFAARKTDKYVRDHLVEYDEKKAGWEEK